MQINFCIPALIVLKGEKKLLWKRPFLCSGSPQNIYFNRNACSTDDTKSTTFYISFLLITELSMKFLESENFFQPYYVDNILSLTTSLIDLSQIVNCTYGGAWNTTHNS